VDGVGGHALPGGKVGERVVGAEDGVRAVHQPERRHRARCNMRSMGRLDGKISLVLGGAGYVGEGIVRSFLEEGAFVIVPSRSQDRLNGLRKLVGGDERLVTVPANVGSPQGAEAVKTQILSKMGRLDA